MREALFVFVVAAILASLGIWASQTGFSPWSLYGLAAVLVALQSFRLLRPQVAVIQANDQ